MNSSIFDMLPPELQMAPVIVAGIAALAGLVLWSAGIKVARGLVAGWMGMALAGVHGKLAVAPHDRFRPGYLWHTGTRRRRAPGSNSLSPRAGDGPRSGWWGWPSPGGFYAWELNHGLTNTGKQAATQMAAADLEISLERLPDATTTMPALKLAGALPAEARQMVGEARQQHAMAWWQGIPEMVRRRMLVLAAAAALAALIVALLFPRYTTWIMTATGGATLILLGLWVLMQVYLPQYERIIPTRATARWGIAAVMVRSSGCSCSRTLFWRKKGEKHEPKERRNEVAAA